MANTSWQGSTGSQSWATTTNWSAVAAPVTSDSAYLRNATSTIDTGLNQLPVGANITLTYLDIEQTFTGTIGLAAQSVKSAAIVSTGTTATATIASHSYSNGDTVEISGANEADYNGTFIISNVAANTFDYTMGADPVDTATGTIRCRKSDFLHIGATSWRIGAPSQSGASSNGSTRLKINFGTIQFAGTVINTGSTSSDSGLEPLQIKGTHSSNILNVQAGRVGVATTRAGDATTLSELNITGGTVNCGSGCTLTTINSAGYLTINSGATTINVTGGTFAANHGDYAITTLNIRNATATVNVRKSSGATIATCRVYSGGTLDLSGNEGNITITTLIVEPGAIVKVNAANPAHLTVTTWTYTNVGSMSFAS